MKLKFIFCWAWLVAASFAFVQAVEPSKDSWPQWGGIQRDHKSAAAGLAQEWPEGGPKLVWKFDGAGMGFSSLAVAEGRGYSLGEKGGTNYAYCVDASNGKEIWRVEVGTSPGDAYNTGWGGGPRSTPTVLNDRVIILDDAGNCCSLNKSDGKVQWKVNLISDLGGSMPNWGYSESPLVDGNRVVVCPGGKNFLTALDLTTGKPILKSSGYEEIAHYVSVIKHSVGGVDCYTTASGKGLVSFAADDGRMLWTNSSTGAKTATIPTPIVQDNYVYHTAGYNMGSVLVKLSSSDKKSVTAEEVWANKNQQNHHGGVVLLEGNVFGFKQNAGWICQDMASGEAKFQTRIEGETGASVAYADGRFYVYGESTGNCYLVQPSTSDWIVKGKVGLPAKSELNRQKGKIWAHPVVAEGKLFLRDLDLIYAFDIKQ